MLSAATVSPTPSISPTAAPDAGGAAAGLIIITIAAVGGFQVSRWLRGARRPRPRGPWFGGREAPEEPQKKPKQT